VRAAGIGLALLSLARFAAASDAAAPTRDYHAYVCAESDDLVQLIRFGPLGLEILKEVRVGSFPAEIEGPHGIGLSPDGDHWYVSISHGLPYGSIHKYATGSDEWLGDVSVGMFPATLAVSPATGLLYVVNFDLYGDMAPSSISVIETGTMIEVARIPTGTMPHGARLDASGTRLYSVNMMNDELVEVDALRFEVGRRLSLAGPQAAASHDHAGMPMSVQPTWVTSPTPQGRVYVAGNGDDSVYEVDLAGWEVSRRFSAGPGPYNLDATPDGKRLVATYKKGGAVGFWDLQQGEEIARVTTTRKVPHAVVVTPDGRFAFVTVEGIGGEPGAFEVYDVATARRIAALDVGKQAGGLALWDPVRSP
jgi:DNA-binding beta-propeller fold protein YncE